jgi:hypothetical protein
VHSELIHAITDSLHQKLKDLGSHIISRHKGLECVQDLMRTDLVDVLPNDSIKELDSFFRGERAYGLDKLYCLFNLQVSSVLENGILNLCFQRCGLLRLDLVKHSNQSEYH